MKINSDKILKHKNLLIIVPIVVLAIIFLCIAIFAINKSPLTETSTMDEAIATTVEPTMDLGETNIKVNAVLGSKDRKVVNDYVVYTGSEFSSVDNSDVLKSIGYESGSYVLVYYDITAKDSNRYYGPTYVSLNGGTYQSDSYILKENDKDVKNLSLATTLKSDTKYACVSVIKCDQFENVQIGFATDKITTMLQLESSTGGDVNEAE